MYQEGPFLVSAIMWSSFVCDMLAYWFVDYTISLNALSAR